MAYLTGKSKDEDHDWYRIAVFILLVISILNLTTTYISIQVYLKMKHSESIKIAEKSNLNVKSSFITFRCHVLLYIFFGGMCLSNFFFNTVSFESQQAAAPAMDSVINILSTLFSLNFVFKKKVVWEFLKRRVTVFQNPSDSPQNKVFQNNSVNPQNSMFQNSSDPQNKDFKDYSRRIAWTEEKKRTINISVI